jgi:hypothetical protein
MQKASRGLLPIVLSWNPGKWMEANEWLNELADLIYVFNTQHVV